MINNQFTKKALGLAAIASLSFFYSCKEKAITGTDTIPEEDRINTVEFQEDYFQPLLEVQYMDEVYTNYMRNPKIALGEITGDPFFSNVNANAYLQLAPAGAFYSVPEDYVLDSTHLIIPFNREVYGDTLDIADGAMEVTIYPVESGIQNPKLYYQNASFPLKDPIITSTFNFETLKTKHEWENDTIENALVIKLPNQYIQEILDLPNTEFTSSGIFLENVNGIYLEAKKLNSQSKGALYYFDIANTNVLKSARIVVHGHKDDKYTPLHFSFQVNETNYFTQLNKTPKAQNAYLYDGEKHVTDSILIESGPGLYTDVTLHNLRDLPASVIHKASIRFTSQPGTENSIWKTPKQLVIERVKIEDGEEVIEKVVDYGKYDGLFPLTGLDFVGGQMGLVSIAGVSHSEYVINFPRLLQQVMKEDVDSLTLRIRVMENYPGGFRLIGSGNSHSDERYNLKVRVVATKI